LRAASRAIIEALSSTRKWWSEAVASGVRRSFAAAFAALGGGSRSASETAIALP
jgi:hypothetical protein